MMASTASKIEDNFSDDELWALYNEELAAKLKFRVHTSRKEITSSILESGSETKGSEGNDVIDFSFAAPSEFRSTESRPIISLQPIQEWEGYVTEIRDDHFIARLTDLTADDETETEVGEFSISDLSTGDGELLCEGAIFRWVIGLQVLRGGTRQRVSQVVFRRLPAWTKNDLFHSEARAAEMTAKIRWE